MLPVAAAAVNWPDATMPPSVWPIATATVSQPDAASAGSQPDVTTTIGRPDATVIVDRACTIKETQCLRKFCLPKILQIVAFRGCWIYRDVVAVAQTGATSKVSTNKTIKHALVRNDTRSARNAAEKTTVVKASENGNCIICATQPAARPAPSNHTFQMSNCNHKVVIKITAERGNWTTVSEQNKNINIVYAYVKNNYRADNYCAALCDTNRWDTC